MKYIVIGLGNYGSSLVVELSQLGHEVVGVDSEEHKVASVKDKIASAVQLDATEVLPLRMLPLSDVDAVIIAIGENFGDSVKTVALLKQEKVKCIYARAISDIHKAVLESLGVDRIITPEKDAAVQLAQSMEFGKFLSSYKIDDSHYVVKFGVPKKFVGQTVANIDLESNFGVEVVSVTATCKARNIFGAEVIKNKVVTESIDDHVLADGDVLIAYGDNKSFHELWKAL